MQDVRGRYTQRGFSKSAAALHFWPLSTQRAYNTYIQKCKNYAAEHSIEIMFPSIEQVASFGVFFFSWLVYQGCLVTGQLTPPEVYFPRSYRRVVTDLLAVSQKLAAL